MLVVASSGDRRPLMLSAWMARISILVLLVVVAFPVSARAAAMVLPGWDLLTTTPDTMFFGVPWKGLPLETYDFGGGPVDTGLADTIVQRLDAANAPSETIDATLVALQMRTVNQVNLGAGLGYYFITLQSARGGPASDGEMTIDFDLAGEVDPHGTLDSFFDVFFDIRLGSLLGPIVMSDDDRITVNDVPWRHLPPFTPPGGKKPVEIPGVNTFLNGVDRTNDFWPVTPFQECTQANGCHVVITAVPEPSLVLLLGLGGLTMLRRRRR